MKFICMYGRGQETNKIALEANSKKQAEDYIYECGNEYYNGYCYRSEDEDEKRNFDYSVEFFDYNNKEHMSILNEQENEFWSA